MTLTN